MFTGIIQAICKVKAVKSVSDGMVLEVDLGELAEQVKIGDSVAINGVCLTVSKLIGQTIGFDVGTETISKSTLGKLKAGDRVNAEPALTASDRLGGHIVQGHVDGTAVIKSIKKSGSYADLTFSAGPQLLDQMILKGSVTSDGISLTVTSLDDTSFGVSIIPTTLKDTTLGAARIGDKVNIETDIVVKTIKSHLNKILASGGNLSIDKLKDLGF